MNFCLYECRVIYLFTETHKRKRRSDKNHQEGPKKLKSNIQSCEIPKLETTEKREEIVDNTSSFQNRISENFSFCDEIDINTTKDKTRTISEKTTGGTSEKLYKQKEIKEESLSHEKDIDTTHMNNEIFRSQSNNNSPSILSFTTNQAEPMKKQSFRQKISRKRRSFSVSRENSLDKDNLTLSNNSSNQKNAQLQEQQQKSSHFSPKLTQSKPELNLVMDFETDPNELINMMS
jgi:hypothetical protein